jgi:fructose-1,6-bisphosphatase/inositol monophosphatase family enzyme
MRHFRSSGLRVERKADGSPVTAADRLIEERLRRVIGRRCPGEPIVGEEFGGEPPTIRVAKQRARSEPPKLRFAERNVGGETYWTIDPIDGTRAFSRGLPTWAIMVGKVERGRPTVGVCDFPALDVTIAAAPGVRAYEREGRRVRLIERPRPVRELAEAVILHGGMRWWPAQDAAGLTRVMRACYLERSFGDCNGFLWALRGQADAVVDCGVKVWDLVPLAALARATGRVMTDFNARPSWTGPRVLFGSPRLVRQIVQVLRAER